METLFFNVLDASFYGSVVIFAVLLLRFLLGNAPRKYICFLWLLAGLRLLAPVEIQSSVSLQPTPEWNRPAVSFTQSAPVETLPQETYTEMSTFHSIAEDSEPVSTYPVVPAPVEEPKAAFDWQSLLPYLWLGVALCFGLYTLCAYLRLKRRVREAVRIPGGWECDKIETAFILGFIRPKIYIPMGLSPAVRSHILAHERTHLEKGDHWVKMVGFLALSIHWFNPLVWLAYTLLCKDIELACDERVVQFMELEERKSYSAALLQCAAHRAHFAACPVAFGEVSVKGRIKKVLNYRRPSFWVSLSAVIAILFVSVCLLTNPKGKAEDADTPTETTVPAEESKLSKEEDMQRRAREGLDAILYAEDGGMHFLGTRENESSVFWQCSYLMHGEDRLWYTVDSRDGYSETSHLVLGGVHYEEKNDLWVVSDPQPDPIEEYRQWFQWDDVENMDGFSESTTVSSNGHSYSEIRFGGTVDKRWVTFQFTFSEDGTLIGGSVTGRKTDYGDVLSITKEEFLEDSAIEVKFRMASDRVRSLEEYEENKIPSNYTEYDQNYALGAGQMRWWYFDKSWQFALGAENATNTGLTLFYCESDDSYQRLTADEGFWIEKLVDGKWTLLTPKAEVANAPETELHVSWNGRDTLKVDWTDSYGSLGPGFYRLGRYHTATMSDGRTETQHCYAKFRLYDPNQGTLLNQCKQALSAVLQADTCHIYSIDYGASLTEPAKHYIQDEVWRQGGDCLELLTYIPRTAESDTITPKGSLWIDGKYYGLEWSGEPLTSPLSACWRGVDGYMDHSNQELWDFDFNWFDSKVEEVEQTGRTVHIYEVYDFDDRFQYSEISCSFDESGNLTGMTHAYLPSRDCVQKDKVIDAEMVVLDSSAEEIRQMIRSQDVTAPLAFSYAADTAKYPKAKTSGFRNTTAKPVSGVDEAIALADKECTLEKALTDIARPYYQTAVYRDEAAKIWKVKLFWWQDDDIYQAVYMNDQGITQMIVYEK